MSKIKGYFKYFFVIFFLVISYLAFLTVKPFMSAILAGAIIAYIFYPFYGVVNRFIKRKNLSAFLVSIFIILLITIPLVVLVDNLASESRFFYLRAKQRLIAGEIFGFECEQGRFCFILNKVKDVTTSQSFKGYIEDAVSRFSNFVLAQASDLVFALPKVFLQMFVAFFVSFYLFKDGTNLMVRLKKILPLKPRFQKEIFRKIDQITYAVIYGSIIIALIQGSLGAIGFFIFGISSPILWGILMSIFALIPFLGTTVIWGPTALFLIIEGLAGGETGVLIKGIGLLVYGILVVSSIDNLLKPKLIGQKAKVHPVLILVGVLGGLVFLGFVGFVVGPLILALFEAFLEIYEKEKSQILK